jgi:hypothetical protein
VGTTALERPTTAAIAVAADGPDTVPGDLHVDRPAWLAAYTAVLVGLDGAAMGTATFGAKVSWLGLHPDTLYVRHFAIPYWALVLATVPTWIAILALAGAYDLGPLGHSRSTWAHVVRAGAQLLALVAVAYYVMHLALLGRGVLAALVPLAVALTLVGRALADATLAGLRRHGRAQRTAFVLGSRRGVEGFVTHLDTRPAAGVRVVGSAVIDPPASIVRDGRSNGHADTDGVSEADGASGANGSSDRVTVSASGASEHTARDITDGSAAAASDGSGGATETGSGGDRRAPLDRTVPVDGPTSGNGAGPGSNGTAPSWQPSLRVVRDTLARTRAEALVIAGGLAPGRLREVAWMLEGTGVELLVVPRPGGTDGLRAAARPVAGLPLLRLER